MVLCAAMLGVAAFVLGPRGLAIGRTAKSPTKEEVLKALLNLPAPPPPNPIWSVGSRRRDEKFYDKKNPPPDNAPIEDLIDYWTHQGESYRELGYNLTPSSQTVERLFGEARQNPSVLTGILDILPGGRRNADFVEEFFNRSIADGSLERDDRTRLKSWLTRHSANFSNELERGVTAVRDENEYVTNQGELLALTTTDFERARPAIDRLYADSNQRVSQVLAKWALYKHALETDSIGDIDRYRDELKAVVEDRAATDGMRDLAMDALVKEKEWPGRDEWYFSLLSDETLADLRVNGQSYTGLTTILYYAPPDKYAAKMIELAKSGNLTVRSAAVKNLIFILNQNPDPEIVKVLLPWLENPRWARSGEDGRNAVLRALQSMTIPESVPGLIAILDEKQSRPAVTAAYAANMVANAANAATVMSGMTTNSNYSVPYTTSNRMIVGDETIYPYRGSAISALVIQKDIRAVPALRRIFPQVEEYQRTEVVRAILTSRGFSAQEQLDALEAAAKIVDIIDPEGPIESSVNHRSSANKAVSQYVIQIRSADIKSILGTILLSTPDVSDDLVRATVDRIDMLDKKDPPLARTLRNIMLNWRGNAVNMLLLRDLKNGRSESAAIVRLLAQRKELRENVQNEIYDTRTGTATATGIAACILEDENNYDPILKGENVEAKIALLACGRLVRARLSVVKVAQDLRSQDPLLRSAAELYLESEDSPEARSIVLSHYPTDTKILGAKTSFDGSTNERGGNEWLVKLFASVHEYFAGEQEGQFERSDDFAESEKKLQKEIKEDSELLGVYSYDSYFVRMYKDKAMFSWEDDPSRYRERTLTPEEFAQLKEYLSTHRVDELKPFLGCYNECEAKELVMLGKIGGRRVYVNADRQPEFFAGLDKIFADFKQGPSILKYALGKALPGLTILLADDDLNAQTVWKNGADLRVLVGNISARKKVERDLEDADEDAEESPETDTQETIGKLRAKREYEGFEWRKLSTDGTAEMASQPTGIEYIPMRDTLPVQATQEQWKARTADFEIRADSEGMYKISRGRLVKFRTGYYESPIVSPNGRWVIAEKYGDEDGTSLVRINLLTGKEFKIAFDAFPMASPIVFIPAANKFLIAGRYYREGEEASDDSEESEPANEGPPPQKYFLLDSETGLLTPALGNVRPLAQQTFRPLQSTSKANEVWAALPDPGRTETVVGVLDTRLFKFKPVLKIPKISFKSMDMWVDEAEGKIYFVYNGHLLSLPLDKPSR